MSQLGDQIALEAFSWVNTPFVHQGRIKGRAVDCANLIEGVVKNAIASVSPDGVELVKEISHYATVEIPRNYQRHSDGIEMLRILDKYLVDVTDQPRQPGDVLALCDEICCEPDKPRHLVIVHEIKANSTYVIDATADGVKRHRMDGRWEKRVHSCWRAVMRYDRFM